jgi:1-deoxy-D-xylulose-5-phosphate synthase
MPQWKTSFQEIEIGTGRTVKEGEELAVLTLGHIGNYVVEVCEMLGEKGISIAHYDMRFAKPLDASLLHQIATNFTKIVTVEDGCIQGGFGSAVLEFLADNNYQLEVKRLGIPDSVIEHGEQLELHKEVGIDPAGIYKTVLGMLDPVSIK